MQEKQY